MQVAHLEKEMRAAFKFFRDEASENPTGYGLVRDRAPDQPDFYSIAATGFALAAIAYGAARGWISHSAGAARCAKTLAACGKLGRFRGFFRHFYHGDGKPYDFEYSTIDTAIFLCGARVAGNYFGGAVKARADETFAAVDFSAFIDGDFFSMAYHPRRGYFAHWDAYAEQLMLYVLAASAGNRDAARLYYAFRRDEGGYGGHEFIYTFTGSLFVHQYSHCFIDFRSRRDRLGVDWYANSVAATLAARQFCIDTRAIHSTYRPDCWGLTACDTPWGYRGNQGSPPCGRLGDGFRAGQSFGVVAPCASLGSLPFCPDEVSETLDYYMSLDAAWGKYGLTDSFSTERNWFNRDVLGIDKGITLLMGANYLDGFVWQYFHDGEIEKAMHILGIK